MPHAIWATMTTLSPVCSSSGYGFARLSSVLRLGRLPALDPPLAPYHLCGYVPYSSMSLVHRRIGWGACLCWIVVKCVCLLPRIRVRGEGLAWESSQLYRGSSSPLVCTRHRLFLVQYVSFHLELECELCSSLGI